MSARQASRLPVGGCWQQRRLPVTPRSFGCFMSCVWRGGVILRRKHASEPDCEPAACVEAFTGPDLSRMVRTSKLAISNLEVRYIRGPGERVHSAPSVSRRKRSQA